MCGGRSAISAPKSPMPVDGRIHDGSINLMQILIPLETARSHISLDIFTDSASATIGAAAGKTGYGNLRIPVS
jgi:hypothetical protein